MQWVMSERTFTGLNLCDDVVGICSVRVLKCVYFYVWMGRGREWIYMNEYITSYELMNVYSSYCPMDVQRAVLPRLALDHLLRQVQAGGGSVCSVYRCGLVTTIR